MYPITHWISYSTAGEVHHFGFWLGCAWHELWYFHLGGNLCPILGN